MGKPDVSKLTKNDIVKLRNLYSAIKDGFVKATDAFGGAPEPDGAPVTAEETDALNALNNKLRGGKGNNA